MEIELKEIITMLKAIQEQLSGFKHVQSLEVKDLYTALAKAQSEMPVAGLNNQNPYFKSKYADLAELVRASRPALTKYGLSVSQRMSQTEDGSNILTTTLGHSSGQWISTTMRVVPPKSDIQTLGSYITYLRRYNYAMIVGIVASDEDDDGEVAMVQAREIMAKGPALNTKYNPKEQPYETISKEQLEEIEYELGEYPDLAEDIMDKMRIQSLADLPKSKYQIAIKRIREIIAARNGLKN